jgi:RNA polymerase sigma factor (sigma-70 family)
VSNPSRRPRLEHVAESLVITLAVGGDRVAFEELVRRRHQGVRRFQRQLCGDSTLADDLTQQVFLRAWRSLRNLQSIDAFNGWMKKLMISVWFDELRRRRISLDQPGSNPLTVEPAVWETPSLERDLENALASLEPRVRICVLLAYSEGNSHSEIAELLQIPLGTVKSHVARGSERLRALLVDYAEADRRQAK